MTTIDFASWVEEEMQQRGWNQAELARRSGVASAVLSRILNRERGAGKRTLTAIARALNYPPEHVFQVAGLLPGSKKRDPRIESVAYLIDQLDDRDVEEVIEFVQLKIKLKERRNALHELENALESIPADRKDLVIDLLQKWLSRNDVVGGA